MKTLHSAVLAITVTFLMFGCTSKPETSPAEVDPRFTLREVMLSMVAPQADALWNAVGISVTEKGQETKGPSTDKEWAALRREAVILAEAMNVILVPGRKIADAGEPLRDPKAELPPDQIEMLINQDRENWIKLARANQDVVMVAVRAIDAKNAEALSNAGTDLSTACGNCHQKYWYPNDPQAEKK
jgi:hypothetical protein